MSDKVSSQNSVPNFRYFDLVLALFTAVIIISNIASSAKIVDLRVSFFGLDLAFDGGTLLFPLAYVCGAVITEIYGFRAARRAIWTGFAALALSAFFLFLLSILPAEASWEEYAGTDAYNAILGGMSTGGIILASLTAYLVGKFVDALIHSKLKVLMEGKLLFVRSLGSSLAAQLLDSIIFIFIATAVGVFPWELFFTLAVTNWILKFLIEVIFTPLTYAAVGFLKKREGQDIYDRGISYNPFKF